MIRAGVVLATAGATCIAALAAGCGGGSSSKPAYCSDVSNLKSSVSALAQVKPVQNGVSSLTSAVQKVQASGQKLVSDGKSAFPSETSALGASIAALGTTAKQLTDPQTQKAALVQLPAEIAAVNTASTAFSNAAKSNCD